MAEKVAGTLDALADDPGDGGGAGGGLEDPQEAPKGHVGDGGKFLQVHVPMDVALKMGKRFSYPEQGLVVRRGIVAIRTGEKPRDLHEEGGGHEAEAGIAGLKLPIEVVRQGDDAGQLPGPEVNAGAAAATAFPA